MHNQPNSRGDQPRDPAPTACEDERTERAVLALVLAEHPAQLSVLELARELCESPEDFAEGDAVERAVRDLVGVGLLHRQGGFVLPTRAALHFDRLDF